MSVRSVSGVKTGTGLTSQAAARLDAVRDMPIPRRIDPDLGEHGMKHLARYILPAGEARPRESAGFTLMEVLIVIFMLGIFLMISWPAMNSGMAGFRLSAAAEEVVTALEFAQLTASSGSDTQVTIDSGTDRIEVKQFKAGVDLFDGAAQYSAAALEGGGFVYSGNPTNKGTDYMIELANDSRFSGVNITASDFGAGGEVTFNSMGTPSKGGTVTLAIGDRQMVAALDAVTGRVTVSE